MRRLLSWYSMHDPAALKSQRASLCGNVVGKALCLERYLPLRGAGGRKELIVGCWGSMWMVIVVHRKGAESGQGESLCLPDRYTRRRKGPRCRLSLQCGRGHMESVVDVHWEDICERAGGAADGDGVELHLVFEVVAYAGEERDGLREG